jgi:predicted ATP-grasp superfamily ATP-dependent carboligase
VRNRGDVVVERFHRGTPVSASFLAHGDRLIELPAGRQTIATSAINRHMDRLTYAGGAIGLSSDLARRATALARRALQSIEGLRGFVGVDMVLGDSAPGADGAGDVVVDINPRLTVSYIALCTLCETSLAAAMLDMDAPLAFDGRVVEFDYTGRVHGGVVT